MNTRKILSKESFFFFLAVFCELIFVGFLIWKRRMPGGHDGFQYFTLQYYFLNSAVTSGEIPQWMPFMTHGTVATWWYVLQAGLLQNVLVHTGSLLKNINFLPIFHIGMFIDELLLLVGVWLLAKRFFSSPLTAFFVTVTVMGSCIWFAQPWWNFHLYYAIPLVLHFLHTFLETGKWRYLLLAGNLLALQMLGGLPYFIPVTTLVIFLYFLFYSIFNFKEVWASIKTLKWGFGFLASLSFIIISFIAVYAVTRIGTDQIANYNFGRAADGTTPLDIFLIYGGNLNLIKWTELFLGISPALDYTLYIGLLPLPLIMLGFLFNLKSKNLHFLFLILSILLFSMGGFFSIYLYYSWPFMKFFRHLASVSPIVKLFLCFLSGFGFEALFIPGIHDNFSWIKRIILPRLVVLMALSMLILSALLFYYSVDPSQGQLVHGMTAHSSCVRHPDGDITLIKSALPTLKKASNRDVLQLRFKRSALFALISSLFIGGLPLLNRKRHYIFLVGALLSLQLSDIYSYKFAETKLRTVILDEDRYKITAFQTMPYAKRRNVSFREDENSRNLILVDPNPSSYQEYGLSYGTLYWVAYSFIFKDMLDDNSSVFRTDHWLLPLDNFMRAYWGQPIHDLSIKPAGLAYYSGFKFPSDYPASMKIAGVTRDKIQFFSRAYLMNSDDAIVSNITAPEYKGDILFLSMPKNNKKVDSKAQEWPSEATLSSDTRLSIPYDIGHFDSNRLEASVDIQNEEGAWMLYSDVWHPFWRAKFNGKPAQVFKANLAYKAIHLNHGKNLVHLYFKSKLTSFLYRFFGLNSLLWIGIIIWRAGRVSFETTRGYEHK